MERGDKRNWFVDEWGLCVDLLWLLKGWDSCTLGGHGALDDLTGGLDSCLFGGL